MLVKFMEKAVQLEPESSTVRVRHQLSVDELERVELKAVLQAMEVSKNCICLCSFSLNP